MSPLPVANVASCRSLTPFSNASSGQSPSHPQRPHQPTTTAALHSRPTTVEVQERVSVGCTVVDTVLACLDLSHEQPATELGAGAKGGTWKGNGLNLTTSSPCICPTRLEPERKPSRCCCRYT